jgi:hypothetical protein
VSDAARLPLPPKRIWFGGYEWSVVPVKMGDAVLDGAVGITYFDEEDENGKPYSIYFGEDKAAREVFDTLWHEFTHALNFAHDVRCKSKSVKKNDEDIAAKHGYAWTQAFLDNPALADWVKRAARCIKAQQEQQASENATRS